MINHLLVTHLLAATVWTGGHLILSILILPKALATNDIDNLLSYESQFEKIAMPAFLLQIATGIWMAYRIQPNIALWFKWDNDLSVLISLKLTLLLLTIIVALHARFRIVPILSKHNLRFFAVHVVTVTLLSIGFVIVGSLFRTGFS